MLVAGTNYGTLRGFVLHLPQQITSMIHLQITARQQRWRQEREGLGVAQLGQHMVACFPSINAHHAVQGP